jgi:hypothetical protein
MAKDGHTTTAWLSERRLAVNSGILDLAHHAENQQLLKSGKREKFNRQ